MLNLTSRGGFLLGSNPSRRFFVILPQRGSTEDTEYIHVGPTHYGDAPTCPRCRRFIGLKPWLAPRRAELKLHGTAFGDFAFFSGSDFLLSERARVAYEDSALAGLSHFSEVDVVRVQPEWTQAPSYFHAEVAHGTSFVDFDGSHITLTSAARDICPVCLYHGTIEAINGIVLDEVAWSGEDIFFARGLSGAVFVTEAFYSMAVRAGLTNVRFVPAFDFVWDSTASSRYGQV